MKGVIASGRWTVVAFTGALLWAAPKPGWTSLSQLSGSYDEAVGSLRGSRFLRKADFIPPKRNSFLEALNKAQNELYERSVLAAVTIDTGKGAGSGFFVDPAGMLMTNAHVVGDVSEVKLQTSRGPKTAKVLASAPGRDVAILQVTGDGFSDWPAFRLEEGDPGLAVGDLVFAIGNPTNLGLSLNAGSISQLRQQTVDYWVDFIQSDIQISRGNSGGPLLDRAGQLIGMNSAIAGTGGRLGMAVDLETLRRSLKEYRETGRLADGAVALGLYGDPFVVMAVGPGSEAAKALRAGDTVVAYDGRRLVAGENALHFFYRSFGTRRPGERVHLTVRRGAPALLRVMPAAEEGKAPEVVTADAVLTPSGVVLLPVGPDSERIYEAMSKQSREEVVLPDGRRFDVGVEYISRTAGPRDSMLFQVAPKEWTDPGSPAEEAVSVIVEEYVVPASQRPGAGR